MSFDATFALALYGAVVATVVAVLQWRAQRSDRAALRLRGSVWTLPGDSEPTTQVRIANVGRRVIEFDQFGVEKKSGELVELWHIAVDRRLEEAQSVATSPAEIDEMFDPHKTVRTVYVRDTTGRIWKMPRGEFKRFRASHERAWRAHYRARKELRGESNPERRLGG